MLDLDCDLYVLPNMHQQYLHDVEEALESDGAAFDDAHIVYAGGTLYGHGAQARHPDADVTVVEKEPLIAYMQSLAAYGIAQDREQEAILEDLFLIDDERPNDPVIESTRTFVHISDERYESILAQHETFLASEFAPFDEPPATMVAEPGVHRDEYLETGIEDELYDEKQLFLNSLDGEDERLEAAFDAVYSQVVDQGRYDEEELAAELDRLGLANQDEVEEEAAFYARNWIDRSHLRWAEQHDVYAFVRDADDGKEITTKQSVGRATIYPDILDEIDDAAPVDQVIVDDIRNVDLDGDIVITNNVFDYIDEDEYAPTVDGLTADDGAYMETSLINHGYDQRGKAIDDAVAPEMDLIEAAPDVDFWWAGKPKQYQGGSLANEGVRLYRPS